MVNLETKLKALLAAGLIGTAGLGMQSCSNPSDSVYYPYTVEAPSTDNPGSGGGTVNPGNGGGEENPNPSGGEENGDNEGKKGETVDFKRDLGVNETDAARIANAQKCTEGDIISLESLPRYATNSSVYVYIDNGFKSKENIIEMSIALPSSYSEPVVAYVFKDTDNNTLYRYVIPSDMKEKFTDAIRAFKN